MKKWLVMLCVCLILPTLCQAAAPDAFDGAWQYGGTRHDHLEDSLPLRDGRMLLVGYTESTDGDLSGINNDNRHDWRPWALCIDDRGEILWQLLPDAGMWGSISFAMAGQDDTLKLLVRSDDDMRVLVVDEYTGKVLSETQVMVEWRASRGSGFETAGLEPLEGGVPVDRMVLEKCHSLGEDMLFWCALWGNRPNGNQISRIWMVRTAEGQGNDVTILPELDNAHAMTILPWAEGYLLIGGISSYPNGEILRRPMLCALREDLSLEWVAFPEVAGSGVLYDAALLPDGSAMAVGFCGDATESITQGYAVCIGANGEVLWQRAYDRDAGEPLLGSLLQVGERYITLGSAVFGRLGLWEMDVQGNITPLAEIGQSLAGPEGIGGELMQVEDQLYIVGNYSNAASGNSNIMVIPLGCIADY